MIGVFFVDAHRFTNRFEGTLPLCDHRLQVGDLLLEWTEDEVVEPGPPIFQNDFPTMLLDNASVGASTRVVPIILGVAPDALLVVPCFCCARTSFGSARFAAYAVRQKGPVEVGWWDAL